MSNVYTAWNAGYEIEITNPPATSGYLGTIVLSYLPGMRADFRDIRFSDLAGTPLDHYRESYTSFSSARFWIKLPANETKIIMYYGNGAVSTASNPAAVFSFWEDFAGTSVSTSRWTQGGTTGTVSNSILTFDPPATLSSYIESKTLFAPNNVVEIRMSHESGQRVIAGFRNRSTQKAAAWQGAATGSGGLYLTDHMFAHNGSSGDWDDDGVNRSGSTYYIYGVAHLVDGPKYYVNYSYRGEITTTTPGNVSLPIQIYAYSGEGYAKIDWIRIRKYTATPPTLVLGKKFVQSLNGFLQQHDYFSDSISTKVSTTSTAKDIFTDRLSTKVSTGFSIGTPEIHSDEIFTKSTIVKDIITERTELRDYSLVSCNVSKSITDAYLQLVAEFADSKVPSEDTTVKYFAHPEGESLDFSTADGEIFTTADDIVFEVDGIKHLLFWGKVIANSPVFGSYYSTLQMQAADASRNLSVQKVPWNLQVVSLDGAFNTWDQWISALVDYQKTGVLVKRIINRGMPNKQFVFRPETTRYEALKQICDYCGLIINIKLVPYGDIIVPGFYAVPASEIDGVDGGFDLPAPVEFVGPENYNIITQPRIESIPDEKYNMVTVYGTIADTGATTVASAYMPSVEAGIKAREYRIQDNSIEEKGSTAEIEAIKWLLYFNAPRATVLMSLVNRFDFELYQRVRFGSGFPLDLQELTNSMQIPYVYAFDPRDEDNTKHTIDVSGVPRPRWMRVSGINYHSEKNSEHVELTLITDYIYSSVDNLISEPYSQFISPGYLKPVSDDSTATIQDIVTNTVERQLSPESCTVLSVNTELRTAIVQTASGKIVTVSLA